MSIRYDTISLRRALLGMVRIIIKIRHIQCAQAFIPLTGMMQKFGLIRGGGWL